MNDTLWQFLQHQWPALLERLGQQGDLVLWSVLLALLMGVPLGLLIFRTRRIKQLTLSIASALWTIPSLALLAFCIPIFGIGARPAIIVLSIYALLPVLRNTVTGLEGVPAATIEAAKGLGFTSMQRLWMVEIPLALPVMIAGIRTAVAMSVGIATLAAFIGAGGLGDFINQGLAVNSTPLILLGAIPAAIMALVLDFSIGRLERALSHVGRKRPAKRRQRQLIFGAMALIITGFALHWGYRVFAGHKKNTVVIASKNFTESIILGNMMADLISAKTHLQVIKKFDLGTTAICQAAMARGDIDIYPEYTGTGYMLVLKQSKHGTPQQIYDYVKTHYKKRFRIIWLKPFGYNNTEALVVRQAFARKHHLRTISDLISVEKQLVMGAPAAFIERPDGFVGLKRVYGLHVKVVRQMDASLMYAAIKHKAVNVIAAFSTDGRIPAWHLVILRDNKHLYPPYYAAPLIRESVLNAHPQIRLALQPLLGTLNDTTMQHLNYDVDLKHRSPAAVARQFLQSRGLLEKNAETTGGM